MQGANVVSRLLERYKRVNYWLLALPMISLVIMFVLDAVNVTTIRLFGFRATPSSKEMIEELMIVVVFVSLAYVLLGPGHIKTDMLKSRFGPRLRFTAGLLSDTAVLLLAAFVTWTTTAGAIHAITHGATKMGDVEMALSPFYIVIAASFALLSFAALLVMVQHILCFKESRHNQTSEQDRDLSAGEPTLKEGAPDI